MKKEKLFLSRNLLFVISFMIFISVFLVPTLSAPYCYDSDSPQTTYKDISGNYVDIFKFGYSVMGDGIMDPIIKYDSCYDGQVEEDGIFYDAVYEVYCGTDSNQHQVYFSCPENWKCSSGLCVDSGKCYGDQCIETCESDLSESDGSYCDCADECAGGSCCNNVCSSSECSTTQSYDVSVGSSISGTAYCASPGKLVYSLEETCLVEVETSSTMSTGESDIRLKTYATTTPNQNLVLDKDDDAKTCSVFGYDEYDMCWPAASGDCPATISMVLSPGLYQMYPVITSFTKFAISSTTPVTGGIRKIKCADCTNTSSANYCDLCSHCGDGEQNCDETCVDGGGSCVLGTESTIEYTPYYEIGLDENVNLNYYELSNLELFFSTSFFCYDGVDNDYDCAIDTDDTDCSFVPSTCIDADGDGKGLGCAVFDCDDTDSSIFENCDTTPPQVNITINDDSVYTNNKTVIVSLDYFDEGSSIASNGCMYSNDGVFDTELWESCESTKQWGFLGADGAKIVYVQVKDIYGNINNTENDSIILDMTPPSVIIDIDTNPTPSFENVSFISTCVDSTSGCNVTTIFTLFGSCSIDYTIGENECLIKLPIECETQNYDYFVNTTDVAGNLNDTNGTINVKKREGCGCVVSNDCFSGMCLGAAICAKLESPELSIIGDYDKIQMPVGETKTIYLSVRNPLDMSDIIEFNIYGDPIQIKYWSYFEGQEYLNRTHKLVYVEANSELVIPINIFGGKAGLNNLIVEAKSNMNGLKTRKDVGVLIYQVDENGVILKSPGLGMYGLIVVILFAAFMFVRKK